MRHPVPSVSYGSTLCRSPKRSDTAGRSARDPEWHELKASGLGSGLCLWADRARSACRLRDQRPRRRSLGMRTHPAKLDFVHNGLREAIRGEPEFRDGKTLHTLTSQPSSYSHQAPGRALALRRHLARKGSGRARGPDRFTLPGSTLSEMLTVRRRAMPPTPSRSQSLNLRPRRPPPPCRPARGRRHGSLWPALWSVAWPKWRGTMSAIATSVEAVRNRSARGSRGLAVAPCADSRPPAQRSARTPARIVRPARNRLTICRRAVPCSSLRVCPDTDGQRK